MPETDGPFIELTLAQYNGIISRLDALEADQKAEDRKDDAAARQTLFGKS